MQPHSSQGLPGVTRSWKRQEGSYLEPSEGAWPADTLTSDFWPGENKLLLFKSTKFVVICYSSSRKLRYPVSIFILCCFFTCVTLCSFVLCCVVFSFFSKCITFKVYKILQNIKIPSDFTNPKCRKFRMFPSFLCFKSSIINTFVHKSFFHIKLG